MHIKVIKGKKYYYESKRIGNKVVSKYIGPVERIRKKKKTVQEIEETAKEDAKEENYYIG